MATVTVLRSAKLEKPFGIGAGKEIFADVKAASGAKLAAADMGLRTIHGMTFTSQSTDVVQVGSVRSPGSLMNVIDVQNMCLATAGSNISVPGSYAFYARVFGE